MLHDPYSLDAVLFVEPSTPFARVDAALRAIGWSPDGRGPAAPPLLPGEPELFGWSWGGGRPRVLASFNPVTRLRALDVGEASPELRGAIAESLTLVSVEEALAWLGSEDPRARLRGLGVLREGERFELLEAVDPLIDDDVAEVGQAAWETTQHLEHLRAAHQQARLLLSTLLGVAKPMLEQLHRPEVLAELAPRPGDAARAFVPEVADAMEAHYAAFWEDTPALEPSGAVQLWGATAGMLRGPNALSARFPGGYRDVAGWLTPERLWVCWRTATGVRREGLVFLQDRWAWFPRPWRALREVVGDHLSPKRKT
ncbi:MAG: hypothetical protein H6740_07485 [Alphaproteobacteria bacterium]|nr:hypothetical protein [Alphaproteobacteria bacterium]